MVDARPDGFPGPAAVAAPEKTAFRGTAIHLRRLARVDSHTSGRLIGQVFFDVEARRAINTPDRVATMMLTIALPLPHCGSLSMTQKLYDRWLPGPFCPLTLPDRENESRPRGGVTVHRNKGLDLKTLTLLPLD